ncbi:hypothetical protein EBU94_05600 [bacterium]|nr:hypothetical protein [bacterium]
MIIGKKGENLNDTEIWIILHFSKNPKKVAELIDKDKINRVLKFYNCAFIYPPTSIRNRRQIDELIENGLPEELNFRKKLGK